MRSHFLQAARGVLFFFVLVCQSNVYAESKSLVVAADNCPALSDFSQALGQLLPRWHLLTSSELQEPGAVQVRVSDNGAIYHVIVGEIARELSDPERRCSDRARAAAVIVQLILEPPLLAEPAPNLARPIHIDLSAAGRFDIAPDLSSGGVLLSGGGHARLTIGGNWVSAVLGIAASTPVTPRFAAYSYSLTRVPIDLGAYSGWRRHKVELGGEIGIVLAPLLIDGKGLSPPRSSLRLETALRVAPELRVWLKQWIAVQLSVDCDIALQTYRLDVDPIGRIGDTPRLWTELELGLLFRRKNF